MVDGTREPARRPVEGAAAVRRLHFGCGPRASPGWINADRLCRPGIDCVGDVRDGLALPDASVGYAVAVHVLQDLPCLDVVPALAELRRVLQPGGVLRFSVPDLERAFAAFARGDARWFYVPDAHAASLGAKLVTQVTWYGSVRTPFTWDFARDACDEAGFTRAERVAFRATTSAYPNIVAFDDRERESLFVEATR